MAASWQTAGTSSPLLQLFPAEIPFLSNLHSFYFHPVFTYYSYFHGCTGVKSLKVVF